MSGAAWETAAIPWTKQLVMQAGGSGQTYRIYLAVPPGEAPEGGFPVLYVLDANSVIGTVVEAVRLQGRSRDGQGSPAVVVGLGYDEEVPFATARFTDYSLPMPVEELPPFSRGGEWPRQGGADDFLRFVLEEVRPMVESMATVNRERQAILGHSLGGLFVLHALYTRPDAFSTYLAGSPSIDWYKRLIFAEEQAFVTQLQPGGKRKQVLIGVGEEEQTHPTRINEHARRGRAAGGFCRLRAGRSVRTVRAGKSHLGAARVHQPRSSLVFEKRVNKKDERRRCKKELFFLRGGSSFLRPVPAPAQSSSVRSCSGRFRFANIPSRFDCAPVSDAQGSAPEFPPMSFGQAGQIRGPSLPEAIRARCLFRREFGTSLCPPG